MTGYKSKVDIAYDYLIDKINKGEYSQGDRLVISQLSKQMSVSDIPVREAIRRLESDGYVEIVANQGAVISGLSKTSLVHIFQIKGVLEGYASRLAVDSITPEIIKKLYTNIERSQEAFTKNDSKKLSQLNYEFHMGMYKNISNQELYKTIAELWQKWSITKNIFSIAPQRTPIAIKEHKKILQLVESKKYDEVEQYVRMHKFAAGIMYSQMLVIDTPP
jgi:DNA-binding GntR family transcriptional regulator